MMNKIKFETLYKKIREDQQGKDLYLQFCETVARSRGQEFTQKQRGAAVWVWGQNSTKQWYGGRSTVKDLCRDNYFNQLEAEGKNE